MDELPEPLLVRAHEGPAPKSADDLLQHGSERPTDSRPIIGKPIWPKDQSVRGTLECIRLRLDAARPRHDLEIEQFRDADTVNAMLVAQEFDRVGSAVVLHDAPPLRRCRGGGFDTGSENADQRATGGVGVIVTDALYDGAEALLAVVKSEGGCVPIAVFWSYSSQNTPSGFRPGNSPDGSVVEPTPRRPFDRVGPPHFQVKRRNSSSLVVAGLPRRQAKTAANVIAIFVPIVASMAERRKSVPGRRNKLYREGSVLWRVPRTRTQDRIAPQNFSA